MKWYITLQFVRMVSGTPEVNSIAFTDKTFATEEMCMVYGQRIAKSFRSDIDSYIIDNAQIFPRCLLVYPND